MSVVVRIANSNQTSRHVRKGANQPEQPNTTYFIKKGVTDMSENNSAVPLPLPQPEVKPKKKWR